jgi:hypothetical protein
MVRLVTHTETGIIGVIRTWLAVDGSAKASLDPPRIFTGAVKGGAVRLARLDPALELVIGEGIETVLSVMQVTGLPGWAALSRKAATNSSRRRAPPSGRPNQRREQRQFQRATAARPAWKGLPCPFTGRNGPSLGKLGPSYKEPARAGESGPIQICRRPYHSRQ